jgi:hypothetical protein
MDLLEPARMKQYRQEIRDDETPEPKPLEYQELYY